MNIQKFKIIFAFLLLVTAGYTSKAVADDSVAAATTTDTANTDDKAQDEADVLRVQTQISPEFTALIGPSTKSKAFGGGGSFHYALSGGFAIGGGIRHAIAVNPNIKNTVFTQFDIRAVFAFNKGLIVTPEDLKTSSGRKKFSGLRMQAMINQYYLTGEVTPYSGPGAGLSYEIYATPRVSTVLGSRVDRITNGNTVLYPTQFYAGLGYRL